MSENNLHGKIWCFGDNINTDIISPAEYMDHSYEVMGKHVLERAFPGFADVISPGDFVVAGNNFGSGSSRETAQIALKYAGVGAIVAKSFARIFFRNCINVGLPVITYPETGLFVQGESLEIDLSTGLIRNLDTGRLHQGSKLPDHVLRIVRAGGLSNYLREVVQSEGYRGRS